MPDDSRPVIPVDPAAEMRITDLYSYNGGIDTLQESYYDEFIEIAETISTNRADEIFVKESSESSKKHKLLASPGVMNHNILIEGLHDEMGWGVDHASGRNWRDLEKVDKNTRSVNDPVCELDISPDDRWGKRTIDAMKNGVGLEVQFGKYAFMVYDVLGKFSHFRRAGRLNLGIELLPSNRLVGNMSTGVGYLEQLKAEMNHLPDGFISPEHRTPVIGIGVGFERNEIDLSDLEVEVLRYQQSRAGDY